MDEIHAVLELFVSCRGSGWPLVRLEAEQQLLTQHLLMAAPMDKEEIEDLIRRCFEADNNGEINFLSFWSGMENLLELLGIREPSAHVDDKVYGLQVFRDGLLAEAMSKHQGPTNSVLLSRDEVLRVIDQTNKSVTSRQSKGHAAGNRCDGGPYQGGEKCSSNPFWDEVYRETALLDATSVLSITELSMMVFGFLKSYLRQESPAMRLSEAVQHNVGQSVECGEPERADTSGVGSGVSDTSGVLAGRTVADTTAGTAHDNQRGLELHSHVFGLRSQTSEIPVNSGEPTMIHERWQKGWELEHPGGHLEDHDASGNTSSVASSTAGGHKRGLEGKTFQEGSESQVADVSHILKGVDPDDPFSQLRHLLIFAGEVVERGVLSKKDMQQLRHLNATAVDCVDRIFVERDKRNEEVNDAVLSLRRMRTEKQQLVERLTSVEHQNNQLQLQQEQQLYERDKVDKLEAALASERLERERLQGLLRDKEEDLRGVTHQKDALLEKISSQNDDFNRLLEAAHKEKAELSEDHRRRMETLIREKEMLEEKFRSAEDRVRAAEAARQQLQGDAHLSATSLRQRILELEEDKQRQEAEAEENEGLILQLQGQLEEKVQQVTILEVKNKQQARLLHQVRGVRNSLMQVLQESKETEVDKRGFTASAMTTGRESEIVKLKAGMKAALAHIKDLETFIDEMRREQRRGIHPRYDVSAASGDSSARPLHKKRTDEPCSRPLMALPTLGDELELSRSASVPNNGSEVSGTELGKRKSRATQRASSGEPDTSSHCDKSRVACEGSGGGARSAASEESIEAPLSKQLSIGEQIATVKRQEAASSEVGFAECSGSLPPRQACTGSSGNAGSFASLRSEPSTIDAVSKEPTSASLPEAEDIFDPLELLKSEDSVAAENQERFAVKRHLSRTSSAAQRVHSADRARQISSKGESSLLHLSSGVTVKSSSTSELPPSGGSTKMSFGHSVSSSGVELSLAGRRCRSRATESNASNEQKDGRIDTSAILPSPVAGSPSGGRGISSSGEKSILSDSLASTTSDGKFLMLTALGEAKRSPTASASRRIEERSQSSKVELTSRALDPSTLSRMFSMLGACAALPGNTPRRAVASTDIGNDAMRDTRDGGGEDSSKTKHRQPNRLSAAATAAISTKDANQFRSLRRVSQASVHHVERPEEESPDHITTRRTSGSVEVADVTALRGEPASDESLLTGEDQWSAQRKPSSSPKAGRSRARRTVSMGITETAENIQARDVAEQQERQPSLTTSGSAAHPGGKEHHLQDSNPSPEVSRKASRAIDSVPKRVSGAEIEKEVAPESGSPTSSLRKRSGVSKSSFAALETCRSRGNANIQRASRSRSSSSEPPSRKASSSHGTSTNQQEHEPKTPHESSNTETSGQQQKLHDCSRAFQGTEFESQVQTLRQQVPLVADQATPQESPGMRDRVGLRKGTTSEERGSNDQLKSPQSLQHELKEECIRLQDEQTASAAALLAAAAGVVDASLQQQQQMIQRQQEHHEDLQRAQQRRIDMLQEQLEHLQKAKEEQRESGEQEQKKLIHTLQAKLEELQRRQEQREHDFQEAQRKLHEELEVQLQKKLEELRRSPRRTNIEAASSCAVGLNALRVSYAHRQDTDLRTSHTLRADYQRVTSGGCNSFENIGHEQTVHQHSQQDTIPRLSDVHAFTTGSEDFSSVNAKRVNQLLSSGKLDDDTVNCMPWHRAETEPLGSAGRMDLHTAGAEARGQPLAEAAGYICEPHDRHSDSDGASSCASSSLMGSQCSLPVHGCSFEEAPTTTSSSFISQSATPAVCSSRPSQRGHYLASEGPVERQIYSAGGDRLLSQSLGAHGREGVLARHNLVRPQQSECVSITPQHISLNSGQADPLFSSCVVQRINSSTGSLWSPKASRNHAAGVGERAACCSTSSSSRPHADPPANFCSGKGTPSRGCQAASKEKLLCGEFRYRSGSSRHLSDQEPGPRESGLGSGRPQLSANHPVSRAERVIPIQQARIDSARFLGSSSISVKAPSLSGISRGQQGAFPSRDSQLPAPLASTRSITSTSSLAFPVQSSSIGHTSRLLQQPINPNQCSPPPTDFLGATSPRSIPSHRQTDSRGSHAGSTKRSRHSRCTESPVLPAPGHPKNESGVRSARSSGVSTRRESLLYGPRRTVNSLMSRQPHSTLSEANPARQRGKMHSCTVGSGSAGYGPTEAISAERQEGSGAASITYRRASSSATHPDVEVSRYPSHHRQKTHRGSSGKDKLDNKRQPDESQNAELAAAGDSSSPPAPSSGWAGFNGGFMSQVQKWIS